MRKPLIKTNFLNFIIFGGVIIMPLFEKKKPKLDLDFPEFPSYKTKKEEFQIKDELPSPLDFPELPPVQPSRREPFPVIKKPLPPVLPPPDIPEEVFIPKRSYSAPKIYSPPRFAQPAPISAPPIRQFRDFEEPEEIIHRVVSEEPLYIKLDKYKEIMEVILKIKAKLKEAEIVLQEINSIRNKEEREIEAWHEHINALKEKLLTLDKDVFEKA